MNLRSIPLLAIALMIVRTLAVGVRVMATAALKYLGAV